jgi:hypothetical protein
VTHLSLVITSSPLRGRRIPLAAARTTIGRQRDCEGILDDDTVSRHHAAIEAHHDGVTLRDLGSSNGTTLNGARVSGPVMLRVGDLIQFGDVGAVVQSDGSEPRGYAVNVGNQYAEQINMVGRDQINHHYQAQRESFLADIAASKTKGRWLVTLGFLMTIAGFGMFGYGVVSFIQAIPSVDINTRPEDAPSPLGPDAGGVPLGVIGLGLGLLGSVALIAGIVFHVSAAARLRRLKNGTGITMR